MARLALGVVGAVIGSYFGPAGARWGFMIGSALGGAVESPQRVQGPRLDDLKAPAANYGSPIPYLIGTARLPGVVAWASDKREISHTESQGKGGGGVETTSYTYEIDVLYVLSINQIAGIRRIWANGELIWTTADDADDESLTASVATERWREIRVYTGAEDQLPDPTYETAVGVGNAPAYRGRGSVFIEGLQLGGSGQLPVLTFEVVRSGTLTPLPARDVILLQNFDGSFADESKYAGVMATEGANPPYIGSVGAKFGDGALMAPPLGGRGWAILKPFGNQIGTKEFCVEFWALRGDASISGTQILGIGAGVTVSAQGDDSITAHFVIGVHSGGISAPAGTWPKGAIRHIALTRANGATHSTLRMFVDGVLIDELINQWSISEPLQTYNYLGVDLGIGLLGTAEVNDTFAGAIDGLRVTLNDPRYTSTFTPPSSAPTDDSRDPIVIITPGEERLADVVSELCQRTGLLTSADLDVTALASDSVRGLAVSQVSTTRQVLEILMSGYFFEAAEAEKIRFVKRGGASVATIPYEDLGASSGDAIEPLPLRRVNDIEMPAQITVRYANVSNDYQDGSESGDRLVTQSTRTEVVELPLGLTPQEAKRLADARTMDVAASMIAIGPVALTRQYARLEPTDVVTLTSPTGSTFRARLLKCTDSQGVRTFEATLDDASAIVSGALTDEGYTATSLVRALGDTALELLDIPILRDADNDPGYYAAMNGTGRWPGAVLMESTDDVTFVEVGSVRNRAVMGTTTTALGDWAGGWVFDETNTVTVDVGDGELSSITRDALLAGTDNAMLLGDEIVRFRTATLVSAGVYTLSGLLRGQRGTEWAMGLHEVGERAVLLGTAGTLRVARQAGELGTLVYHRAVTVGRSVSAAQSESITPAGVGLMPFAPVDVRLQRAVDGTVTATWKRRTRMSTRLTGAAGINVPLGEASESYLLEVLDDADAVVSSQIVNTSTATIKSIDRAWQFADDSASVVVESGGQILCGRYPQGTAVGGIYRLDSAHARADFKALPTTAYNDRVTGAVVAGGRIYYTYVDGPNDSKILCSSITDLQTYLHTYTGASSADFVAPPATDGTVIYAAAFYSGALLKLDLDLALLDSWAGAGLGARTVQIESGYVWAAGSAAIHRLDIAAGTVSEYTLLPEVPAALHISGEIGFALYTGRVSVFDVATGIEIASHAAIATGVQVQFVRALGALAVVGGLDDPSDPYVLLLDLTTGAESGRVHIPRLAGLAGGTDDTLYVCVIRDDVPGGVITTQAWSAVDFEGGRLRVRQISATVGPGRAATIDL